MFLPNSYQVSHASPTIARDPGRLAPESRRSPVVEAIRGRKIKENDQKIIGGGRLSPLLSNLLPGLGRNLPSYYFQQ